MKSFGIAAMLALALVSCQRNEEAGAEKSGGSSQKSGSSADSGDAGESGNAPAKSGKASERPANVPKPPPMAEPVPGKPGFVKSPFNGKIVDVTGIPAGRLVADPTYPAEEKKYFRVPEMEELAEEDETDETTPFGDNETAKTEAKEARPVPGKPGFYFSPFDNSEIELPDAAPGEVVMDPSATPFEPRYFKIPGGK